VESTAAPAVAAATALGKAGARSEYEGQDYDMQFAHMRLLNHQNSALRIRSE
jgi:hypothetical protein